MTDKPEAPTECPVNEYAPREQRQESKSDNNLRDYPRINLRKPDQEIVTACDGISLTLYRRNWFFYDELGLVNIKDFSQSGVGVLTPLSLTLDEKVWLKMEDEYFPFKVMRRYPINKRLNFIGGKWVERSEDAYNKISHLCHLKGSL